MEDEAPAGDDSHCRGGDRAGGMLRLAGLVLRFILHSKKAKKEAVGERGADSPLLGKRVSPGALG